MDRLLLRAASTALCVIVVACSKNESENPPSAVEPPVTPSARADSPPERQEPATPTQPPPGYEEMTVGGVAPTPQGNAVVLMDPIANVAVLIFIGGTEALSIALRLRREKYARPLTHDLLDDMVGRLGGTIVGVRVDKIEDNVFHGTVLLDQDGTIAKVDARPSDAMALAVGNRVPIFVSKNVIRQAGVDLSKLNVKPPEEVEPAGAVPERPGEVRL